MAHTWRSGAPDPRLTHYSEAAAMDPRRRSTAPQDPKKRLPSTSPERPRPAKQARPNETNSAGHHSRQSSVSVTKDSHRSGVANVATLRKEGPGMHSPVSPSRRSGESSPVRLREEHPPQSIEAALQAFGSAISSQAAIERRQQEASAAHKRAREEYERLKKAHNYDGYPALKEARTRARTRAEQEVERVRKDAAKMQTASTSPAISSLATLLRSACQPDQTSRDLKSVLTKQEEDFKVIRSQLKTTEDQIAEMRRVAIDEANKSALERGNLSTSFDKVQEQLKATQEQQANTERKAEDAAMGNDSLKKSVLKVQAEQLDLKRTRDSNANTNDMLSNAIKTLQEQLGDVTLARTTAEKATQDAQASRTAMADLIEKFEGLETKVDNVAKAANHAKSDADQVTTLQERIHALETDAKRAGNVQASSNAAGDAQTQQTASRIDALKRDVGEIEDQQEKLIQDVAGIRKSNAGLSKDVTSLKQAATPAQMERTGYDEAQVTDILARLDVFETFMDTFDEHQTERDLELLKMAEERVKADLSSAIKQNADRLSELDNELVEVRDSVSRLGSVTQNLITREEQTQALVAVVDPLKGQVSRLQQHVDRQRQASVSAAPPPTFPHSPQLPNGVHSPHQQVNGHARTPTPIAPAPPPPGQQSVQDIVRLDNRCDSIIDTLRHLKQRVDNLTSDPIVQAMSTQIAAMFPEAKNFNSSYRALAERTEELKQEMRDAIEAMKKNVASAGASKETTDVLAQHTKRMHDLDEEVSAMREEGRKTKSDITEMTEALGELVGKAKAAEVKQTEVGQQLPALKAAIKELQQQTGMDPDGE